MQPVSYSSSYNSSFLIHYSLAKINSKNYLTRLKMSRSADAFLIKLLHKKGHSLVDSCLHAATVRNAPCASTEMREFYFLNAFEGANKLGQPSLHLCDGIGLQIHPSEDAAAKLKHSYRMIISIWHWLAINWKRNIKKMVLMSWQFKKYDLSLTASLWLNFNEFIGAYD